MTPETLSLSAFGPFGGSVTVDFSVFAKSQLFLIEGPTGAGKTSLLDALCFALFGKVPGARGEHRIPLRSGHAAPTERTEVALTFSLGPSRYRITRVPAHERAKKRGIGVTTESASATLERWREGGWALLATSVTAADAEIQALLGLNCEQFQQVLLIPQGEFRKFLIATSDEKEVLLERLFGTTLYRDVALELKRRKSRLEAAGHDARTRQQGVLARAQVTSLEDLRTRCAEADHFLGSATTRLSIADQQCKGAQARRAELELLHHEVSERDEARAGVVVLERQSATMLAHQRSLVQARRADPVLHASSELETRAAALSACDAQQVGLVAARARAAEALQQGERDAERVGELRAGADAAGGSIERLKPLLSVEQSRGEAQRALQEASAQSARASAALASLDAALTRLEGRHAESEAALRSLEGAAVEAVSWNHAVEVRKKNLIRRQELESARERAARHVLEVVRAREALVADERRRTAAHLHFDEGRRARESAAAATLAAALQPEVPCPVCGSEVHPRPAVATQTPVGLEELEARAAEVATLQQVLDDRRRQLSLEEQREAVHRAELEALERELDDDAACSLESLAEELAAAEVRRAELTRKAAEERQLREVLSATGTERERLRAERDRASAEMHRTAQLRGLAWVKDAELRERLSAQVAEGRTVAGLLAEAERTRDHYLAEAKSLEARVVDASLVLRGCEARLLEKDAERQARRDERDVAEAALKEVLAASGFEEVSAAKGAMLSGARRSALEGDLLEYERARASAVARLEVCEGRLSGRVPVEGLEPLEPVRAQALELETAHREASRQEGEARARATSLRSDLAYVEEQERAFAKVDEELRLLGRLAEVVDGKNGRNLSLQNFVLGSRMDEVAHAASQRLLKMSRGRYALVRTGAVRHKGRQAGLELAVHDRHLDTERFVQTLSGGEMFLASLSLALGLADVVTRRRGAVQLDALFIDEGFGTLDDETLDLVMRTLEELRSGGRLVGLISHVNEMKARIPARLTVTRTPSGSFVS